MKSPKKFLGVPFLSALVLMNAACGMLSTMGDGVLSTVTRSESPFQSVVLAGTGTVTLAYSTNQSVSINAEDNLIPLITTSVDNGALTISENNIWATKPIHYTVAVASLSAVTLAGSGNIVFQNTFTNGDISVNLTGSGGVTANVQATSFEILLSGSGNVTANGAAASEKLTITGSGSANLSGISATNGTVSIMGSGGCKAWISGNAAISISGSGSVSLISSPSNLTQTILGSGTVSVASGK